MDEPALVEELARLHRGRGLRDADVGAELGPGLRTLLGLTATAPVTGHGVIERLQDAITALPQDLRVVFLHATGARSTEPFLKDRLAVAGQLIDRDVRTVRRRLADANRLVVQSLVATASGQGPAPNPLVTVSHESETDLRTSPVRLTARRTLLHRSPGRLPVRERFGVPGRPTTERPAVEVSGAELVELRALSGTIWEADLLLPHRETGQTSSFSITVPADRSDLRPFTFVVPSEPVSSCSVSVHVGDGELVRNPMVVRGLLPMMLYENPPVLGDEATAAEPVDGSITLSAARPQVGLAYGVVWEWADLPGRPPAGRAEPPD